MWLWTSKVSPESKIIGTLITLGLNVSSAIHDGATGRGGSAAKSGISGVLAAGLQNSLALVALALTLPMVAVALEPLLHMPVRLVPMLKSGSMVREALSAAMASTTILVVMVSKGARALLFAEAQRVLVELLVAVFADAV